MIVLLDRVGDAFQSGRRMIELACDFDSQFRVPANGVIINGDSTIGRNEFAAFGQHQRIDFQRARFHAARSGK